jgi:capsular polysaccharide biosynthesis protein
MNTHEADNSPGTPAIIIDPRILLRVYLNKLKYILVVTFVALLIAVVWVKVKVVPSWKANCYIIRAPKNMSTPVDMPYLYQTFDINTILETVRTRDVLNDVIQQLELDLSTEQLFRRIEVQRGNRSNVLRFSVAWNDAEMAAIVANTTAESFIANNTKLLNSATMKIHTYYIDQQRQRMANIMDLEEQYEQYRAEYGVISIPHETQTKFDQLKEIELKMIENSLRISDMDSKIGEMEDKLSVLPEEVIQTWTYTATDEKKLLALEKDLELLKSRYTNDNPKVRKVISEINELKKTMQTNNRDLPEAVTWGPSGLTEVYTVDKSRFEAERRGAIRMNEEFQKEVNLIRASLENLTQIQKEFFEVERQLELNRDILRLVESRLAESRMAMQSNVSDYEILESAKAPTFPESGRRKLIVVVVGMLVFIGSSMFIVFKEILDTRTKSAKDFHEGVKIPLCGVLPDEHQVEEKIFYRNLQVLVENILHHTESPQTPVIFFGSDIRETGKSFIAKEVIRMLSTQNKRILYIDSLLETNPDLSPYLLNDWLYQRSDTIRLDTADRQIHHAYFLVDDSTFSTVMEPERMRSLLSHFNAYDYVVWELFEYEYNIQLFTDICSAGDTLVLVGRFDRSSRNSLRKAVSFIKDRGLNNIYGVLNYVPKDFFTERY